MKTTADQILHVFDQSDYAERCVLLHKLIDSVAPQKIEFGKVLNHQGVLPILNPPTPQAALDAITYMLVKLEPEKYMTVHSPHVEEIVRGMKDKTRRMAKRWDFSGDDMLKRQDMRVEALAYARDLINACAQTLGYTPPPQLICSDMYVPALGLASYAHETHAILTKAPCNYKSFEQFVDAMVHEAVHGYQHKRAITGIDDMIDAAGSTHTRMVALNYLGHQIQRLPEAVKVFDEAGNADILYQISPNEIHARNYGEAVTNALMQQVKASGHAAKAHRRGASSYLGI